MRLSKEQISGLQIILKDLSLNYTDEQAQVVGMAIMRFAIAKAQRDQRLMNEMENAYGQVFRDYESFTEQSHSLS